jgi:hypothetical protein
MMKVQRMSDERSDIQGAMDGTADAMILQNARELRSDGGHDTTAMVL